MTDIALALRAWRQAPGFTAIAVVSMAFGIGANTAIFTLVDQVLLRPLPIPNPQELVQVTKLGATYGNNWGDGSELSYPMYVDLKSAAMTGRAQPDAAQAARVFSGLFGRFGLAFQIRYGERTERVVGELVSGTYFPVLGVGAALGRTLTPDDDRAPGAHPVAVLSHAFWTSRFASDPGVLGQKIIINSHPFTIVGVARTGFDGIELGRRTQVFVPILMKAQMTPGWNALDDRRFQWVRVFGRLRPGVSPSQAEAALQPFYRSLLEMEVKEPAFANASQTVRERFLKNRIQIVPSAHGRSEFRTALTKPLWLLMGIAAGVLLIACANVANLVLARGASRQREIAVRLALGATRRRLVQQLLVESVMLALAGGLAGLALAGAGAPLVLSFFVNPESPQPISTAPDLRILGFTFAVSMLTGVLFGLAPAFRSTRPDLAPTLKDEAGSVLGGGSARIRKGLVASQVSVSLLLLIGAGLFIRTLENLFAVDVGFETSRLVSFTVDPPLNGYAPERTKEFAKTLLDRLTASPGVVGAGLASMRLLEGNQWSSTFTIEGYQPKADERPTQLCNAVSPGYFKAMGIPLVMGRDFDRRDEQSVAPPVEGLRRPPPFRVAIANERFVRQYYGNGSPIGRRIGFGSDPNTKTPIEIVGVVRDSKYTDVRDETQRQLFFPYLESPTPSGFTVYVRTNRDAESLFQLARRTVQQLDPNLPVFGMRKLEDQVEQSLSNERLVAAMSSIFGTLATLLALVGLYGVMSYTVARRTREFGIRIALGAQAGNIRWMVIREVATITLVGIAIGLPAAWWLGRLVASQLYGVQAADPTTFAAVLSVLAVVSVLAGLVPSTRAARVDPTTALRYE